MKCLSSNSEAGKKGQGGDSSIYVLTYWMMPTHSEEGSLLSPLIQMLISTENTLTGTPRNDV